MAMATIHTVREGGPGGDVVARFVHADDARTFCAHSTGREPDRVLWHTDRSGFYNDRYQGGYINHTPRKAGS